MPRSEFPRAVKVAALKRCTDEKGILRCEDCGVALKAGRFAFDHDIADGAGGKPTLENCRVLCSGKGSCHEKKTAKHDIPLVAKIKRIEAKRLGADRQRPKMQSRGFDKAKAQKRASTPLDKWRGWKP